MSHLKLFDFPTEKDNSQRANENPALKCIITVSEPPCAEPHAGWCGGRVKYPWLPD